MNKFVSALSTLSVVLQYGLTQPILSNISIQDKHDETTEVIKMYSSTKMNTFNFYISEK